MDCDGEAATRGSTVRKKTILVVDDDPTVTLFVSLFNLFTSLLHLLGFAFGDD